MSHATSVFDLSRKTTRYLASADTWPQFLQTAAWNYRYSFPNQVLIYAQKPDAIACASMDDWNKKLHRLVNPGASGIALLADAGDELQLNYIFDVSDTHSPSGAQIPLWTMTPEKEEDIRHALADAFLASSHPYRQEFMEPDATTFFYEISFGLCNQLAAPAVRDLLAVKDSCEALRELSDEDLEAEFRALLHCSITALMMIRCALEPDIDPQIWESAGRFEDLQVMAILGQATQSLARQGLEVARNAVRKWDKRHREEQKHDQEHFISADRGIPNSSSDHSDAEASEPLREDAQAVSSGLQAQPIYTNAAVRRTDGSPVQHRGIDSDAGSSGNGSVAGAVSGAGESGERSGLDEAHEPDAESGRREGLSGDNLRLTDESGNALPNAADEGLHVEFPSPAQQQAIIDAAVSPLKLTQDQVDVVLNQIIDSMGVDNKLLAVFQDEPNSSEAISALREAYEPLDDIYRLAFDGKTAAVAGRPYGIEVKRGGSYLISWNEFAAFFQKQVDSRRFAPPLESQPTSSAELKEGQIILLSGTQYKVTAISATVVGLQDVNYPIFTNTISRNTLDLLLRNNAPAVKPPREMPTHIPEPLIDHPELRHRDLSRDARIDKVVLTDLLYYIGTYRVTYSLQMPELSLHDKEGYDEEKARIDSILVSPDASANQENIQQALGFCARWLLPFADAVKADVRQELHQVVTAAEDLLRNWGTYSLQDSIGSEVTSEPFEASREEEVVFTADSFHVGDFYEDAHGRGVISQISPEQYEGNHKALFSYTDPDAPEGSRDAKGYIMELSGAIDRLNNGQATLLSAAEYQAQRDARPVAPATQSTEPSLFDFTFDAPPAVEEVKSDPINAHASPTVSPSDRRNFRIGVEAENYGSPKARFQGNIAAIRLLKELEAQDRLATADEQKILSRYVGWGGLPDAFDETKQQWHEEYTVLKELLTEEEYRAARESTLTAFYTPPAVTEAIYAGLKQLGFQGGNILEIIIPSLIQRNGIIKKYALAV